VRTGEGVADDWAYYALQYQTAVIESGVWGQGVNIYSMRVCMCVVSFRIYMYITLSGELLPLQFTSSGHTQDANRARSDVCILIYFYIISFFSSSFFLFILAFALYSRIPCTSRLTTAFTPEQFDCLYWLLIRLENTCISRTNNTQYIDIRWRRIPKYITY
jgi:hypothetical protein